MPSDLQTNTHTHRPTCMHTCMYARAHSWPRVCIHTDLHMQIHTHAAVDQSARTRKRTCTCRKAIKCCDIGAAIWFLIKTRQAGKEAAHLDPKTISSAKCPSVVYLLMDLSSLRMEVFFLFSILLSCCTHAHTHMRWYTHARGVKLEMRGACTKQATISFPQHCQFLGLILRQDATVQEEKIVWMHFLNRCTAP